MAPDGARSRRSGSRIETAIARAPGRRGRRPLEGSYPYLWLDAKQLKVRDGGHVGSKALVVAYAVHETGRREVIGIDLGEVESEAFWLEFLRALRERGLTLSASASPTSTRG